MDEHRIRLNGQTLRIALQPGVFAPSVASLLLASRLSKVKGLRVCDLTTGCGIHAVLCAKLGASHVDAIDIDGGAVTIARYNAAVNRVERRMQITSISFTHFAPQHRYDLVVFNAPQTPTAVAPPAENAVSLQAGKDGADGIAEQPLRRLIEGA
jgi:tRNA1(Val) A37 N6-methylase TrmN6